MKNVIGLDIGAKSIKLVNLALRGKDIELLKLEIIEAPKTSNQKEIIELLRIMFNSHVIKPNTPMCLSISAEESFFKIIPVKSKKTNKLKELIKDELRKNVVFSLEDCLWDYSLLAYKPKEMLSDVLLVAAKKEAVSEKMQLIKQSGNSASLINLDILAAYNCLKFNTELLSGKLYALVDISSVKTQVLIFDEKENFWMRTIPFGGDKLTDVIAKSLGLSPDEALEHKKNMLLQEDISAQLKEPSGLVMKEIAAELDKTFNYYYFQASDSAAKGVDHKIDEIFLSGSGSVYFGLDKFLSNALNISTRYIYPLNKVIVKDKKILSKNNALNAQLPQFSTAIGLALQGLNVVRIKIDLTKMTRESFIKKVKLNDIYNILIVLSACLFLFLWVQIISLNKKSKTMLARKKELDTISQEYMPKLTDLKAKNDETNYQINTFDTILSNRNIISRILYEISEIISQETWITNFMVKFNYQEGSGELSLSGKSASYPGINELISGLKDTGYFEDIKPVSSKIVIDQITKEEVVSFIIQLEIRKT